MIAAVAALTLTLCSCVSQASRPHPVGVPANATFVPAGKIGGSWQQCEKGGPVDAPRCTVWNGAGEVLTSDVYLAYDGRPVSSEELLVSDDNPHALGGYVRLKNGRTLIPANKFEAGKRFLDEFGRKVTRTSSRESGS